MVLLDINCVGDDNITIMFQLCDAEDGGDNANLWGPTNFYSGYDYYFIREPIDVAQCFHSC